MVLNGQVTDGQVTDGQVFNKSQCCLLKWRNRSGYLHSIDLIRVILFVELHKGCQFTQHGLSNVSMQLSEWI